MFAISQQMLDEERASNAYTFIGVMQIVQSLTEAGELITKFNDFFDFSTEYDTSKIDDKNRLKFQFRIYAATGGNPVAILWGVAP